MRRIVCVAVLLLPATACAARADEPFDYFTNSWAMVGLKDYASVTRITPQNELLLGDKQRLRICCGESLVPLSRRQVKTRWERWLPVILLTAQRNNVRYDFRIWATPLPDVKDRQAAYEGPTEGENFQTWVWTKATNTGSQTAQANLQAERIGNPAASPQPWGHRLEPGESADVVWRIPYFVTDKTYENEQPQAWLDYTAQYWHSLLSSGAVISVPEQRASDALRASHVDQFLDNDAGVVHGGEGFYDEFYIRDGAYQVLQFEEAGFLAAARRALDAYLGAQRPDGRFETQAGQFDANGQAIWTLWQYYLITGDRDWLELSYPAMYKGVEWIIKARREAPADSPFAGLLPNALADGENLWDGKYHIVGYDFWNLRGLLCTCDAARELGKQTDADRMAAEIASYRAALDAAWQRSGVPHFPPSWEKAGTHWGNTETLWPTPLFATDDARVAALVNEVRRHHGGGFFEGTIRWSPDFPRRVIHPYMSSYTTMASLIRQEHEQVVEDFYWYLLHSTAAHAFPEGIYYEQRVAWNDTIPHATGAANYCFLLRHMLLHEQADELHLLPAVPDWWLDAGRCIQVERAPTHFGPVDLTIKGNETGVDITWKSPVRKVPRRVVLHLPESRRATAVPQGIIVEYRTPQTRRWDFAAVLRDYDKIKPREVPGLLNFPLDDPPAAANCLPLDLSALANTDPFNAPFGVFRPGKFLFSGLQVGTQSVAGIPFSVLDPARNSDCGLIVLQGGTPQEKAAGFPKEVVIPIGKTGKRLFFLGNVAGWTGGDAGVGQDGAIAEYVIQYSDGQNQTVPLVVGKTVDDWAVAPHATQVESGLRGDPWHLNVCGVALRPVPVQSVLFRDLGTVSAPVLAAVTLEQ